MLELKEVNGAVLGVRGALLGALWCSIEPVLWLEYFISLPPEMCYGPGLYAAVGAGVRLVFPACL